MKTPKLSVKERIIALLNLSEENYAAIVEKYGYDFAWYYTQQHEWSVVYLTRSAAYWNWWKRLWETRDEVFLKDMEAYLNTNSEAHLQELWFDHHMPNEIDSVPTKYVLQESYRLMLEDVNEEKKGLLI